jgi:FkbM family methyltransferase
MTEAVQPGFVVWDIGANRGYYTKTFAKLVRSTGHVYAIEPAPKNIRFLKQELHGIGNVELIEGALSEESGMITFLEDRGKGTTSRIVDANFKPSTGQNLVTVPVMTADSLTTEKQCSFPDLIKIDTEGFELEVITGMSDVLQNEQLKVVCVEVHFRRLNERGLDHAPREIENRLKSAGFSVNWCDPSHIIATSLPSR